MRSIRDIAKKATNVALIMEGREKGDTQDLIKYKKAVTIDNCEMCMLPDDEGNYKRQYVYIVKEFPDKFFFAGFVLKKIFDDIAAEYQGDWEEMYDAVKKEGLRVKFGEKETRNKGEDGYRVVTTIEVLE